MNVGRSKQVIAVVCLSLLAGTAPVFAQAPPGAASAPVAQGGEIYRQHCASCHGEQAKGNGPAASAMKAQPTDLTRLTRAGQFPAAAVEAIIRGESEPDPVRPAAPDHEPIPAHGSYAMPVWGPYFMSVAGGEREAQERVTNLVKYIESIQAR